MTHIPSVTRGGAPHVPILIGPLSVQFLVTGGESNGSVALFEVDIPAGAKLPAPAHSHDAYEETIFGLEGAAIWTVDGIRHRVGPGDTLCIPRGAVHRFDNEGAERAVSLCVISPAAIGPAFFQESAEVVNSAAGGSPDRARMMEVYRRYGLTPAPPA